MKTHLQEQEFVPDRTPVFIHLQQHVLGGLHIGQQPVGWLCVSTAFAVPIPSKRAINAAKSPFFFIVDSPPFRFLICMYQDTKHEGVFVKREFVRRTFSVSG